MKLETIIDELSNALRALKFEVPVTCVYNPLVYARARHLEYWRRYATAPKEIVLIGMNPGPWGMAQTGVPFGEVAAVRDWLGIEGPVDTPASMHPKRPVTGFGCNRSEVSGRRLWGWARQRYTTPANFFSRFFVANYCPLLFIEAGGRNRTPNQLKAGERKRLVEICDHALRRTIDKLAPHYVIGVGRFAEQRVRSALSGHKVTIGRITHPSPANPAANSGWQDLIEKELTFMGIEL